MQTYPLVFREWTPPGIYDTYCKSARVKHLMVSISVNRSVIVMSRWFIGKIIPTEIT